MNFDEAHAAGVWWEDLGLSRVIGCVGCAIRVQGLHKFGVKGY